MLGPLRWRPFEIRRVAGASHTQAADEPSEATGDQGKHIAKQLGLRVERLLDLRRPCHAGPVDARELASHTDRLRHLEPLNVAPNNLVLAGPAPQEPSDPPRTRQGGSASDSLPTLPSRGTRGFDPSCSEMHRWQRPKAGAASRDAHTYTICAHSLHTVSACSITVSTAAACLSGG